MYGWQIFFHRRRRVLVWWGLSVVLAISLMLALLPPLHADANVPAGPSLAGTGAPHGLGPMLSPAPVSSARFMASYEVAER